MLASGQTGLDPEVPHWMTRMGRAREGFEQFHGDKEATHVTCDNMVVTARQSSACPQYACEPWGQSTNYCREQVHLLSL